MKAQMILVNMNRLFRKARRTGSTMLALAVAAISLSSAHAQSSLDPQVRLPNGQWFERVEDMRVKVPGGTVRVIRQYDGYRWQINPAWNSLKFEFDNAYAAGFGCVGCNTGATSATLYQPPEAEPETLAVSDTFGGTLIPGAIQPVTPPPAGTVTVEYGPLYAIARNGAWFNVDSALKTFAMSSDNRYTLKPLIPIPPPPDTAPLPGFGSVTPTAGGGYAIRPDKNAVIPDYVQGFRWEDKTGDWIEYDRKGRIQRYGDRNNITVNMVYTGDLLTSVKDHNGKTVLFIEYTGSQITAIKDNPETGGTEPQRSVNYVYGAKGNLTRVTDPMKFPTTYTYDDKGRLETIIDAENRVKTLTYSATNRIKTLTETDGGTTEYEYDYDKTKKEFYVKVLAPILPDGLRRSQFYTYDTQGRLLKMSANGRTMVEMSVDGRNQKFVNEHGMVTEIRRNEFDLVTAGIYPDGTSDATIYDSRFLNVLEERDENGVATAYEYDDKGNLVKVVAAKGQPEQVTFTFTLNGAGQWISSTRPGKTELNGMVTPPATWGATYDDAGNRDSLTDAENFTIRYEYNRSGQLTKLIDQKQKEWRYFYDANGRLTATVNPLEHRTSLEYDKVGNLTKVTDPRGKTLAYTYDARNRTTSIADHSGAAFTSAFDIGGRLTARGDASGKGIKIQSDVVGRMVKVTDAKGHTYSFDYTGADGQDKGGRAPAKVTYPTYELQMQYSERRRLTRLTHVAGTEGRVMNITHDRVGRTKTTTDPNGKTRYIDYDALGRAIKLTDPLGKSLNMVYNVAGDLIEIKNYNGKVTRFAYDKRGLLTEETDPLGKIHRYTYDERGLQTEGQRPNGKKISFAYDDAERLVEQKAFGTGDVLEQTVGFDYDDASNLTGWNNGAFRGVRVVDDMDRLTSETINYGSFSLSHSYTYYANNQVKTYTGPDGVTVTYRYDASGQLEGVDIPGEGSISVAEWNWDLPKKVVLPGGTVQEIERDGYQELTRLRVKNPGQQTLFDLENKYGKLSEVKERKIDGNIATYTYDDAARLTAVDAGLFNSNTQSFELDAQGNRTTFSKTSGTWTYDDAGQLLQRGSVTYSYDDAGNMTRKVDSSLAEPARTTTYGYDAYNRLVEVKNGSGTRIAQYTYDPFDRRLSKTTGTAAPVTTHYLHADNGLLAEADQAGSVKTGYGWHPEYPYSTYPLYAKIVGAAANRYVYYHNDHLGTPLRITDKAGNLVWSADYDNFGKASIQNAADPALAVTSNLRYPGQYFDAETGLHYNYRRFYEPETGRYTTRDPLGFGGGANLYLYAKHSPANLIDPTGENPVAAILAAACLANCGWEAYKQSNCGDVDYGEAAICVGLCALELLPIPTPCTKLGKIALAGLGIGLAAAAPTFADWMGGLMNSFPAETLVHIKDAQTGQPGMKPIGEIKIGDEVLAWAEWRDTPAKDAKDAKSYEKVTDVYVTKETQRTLVHLTLDNGETLTATDGHPFHTSEGWRDAILLKRGGQLDIKGKDGKLATATIQDVRHEQRTLTTYNLEVANAHTFFVGEGGYLVHNAKCNIGIKHSSRKKAKEAAEHPHPGKKLPTPPKDSPKRKAYDEQQKYRNPERHPDSNHPDSHFHDRNKSSADVNRHHYY